ncbi:hypothetical protein SanaruYs_36370 [Chryseotalea sanaruensis]|uniref:Uncharacterized protein n=1 Tax=Chryseotalea sanaruensis TaxID=2482724 RepID=A0A401UEX0_9BACT|nr:hypothetical protein [Chryseotalea sanaruensis]GCC53394.1 hypothetical protein SanaruYs_36370 [Chryseotalea sanaruensis]
MSDSRNQIDILSIKENTQVNLSINGGEWVIKEDGIHQKLKAGNRKAASGTILLYQLSNPNAMEQLRMKASLASKYCTGLIFNYRDKYNYSIFLVNRGAGTSRNYAVEIAQIVDGDYRSICKEKHPDQFSEEVLFVLKNQTGRLRFEFNEAIIFEWEGMQFSSSLGIGLYSQQNDDAVFRELSVLSATTIFPVENVQAPSPVPIPAPTHTESDHQINNTINSFLSLKKPSSKTIVQFDEIFTVPLDSFYTSLNDLVNGAGDDDVQTGFRKLETLDLRPKRWYRQLRAVNNLLNTLENLKDSKRIQRDKALQSLGAELTKDNSTPDGIKIAENLIIKLTDELQSLLGEIERAQDTKALLLREIRTNGFSVGDITNPKLKELGFDFEISKSFPNLSTSKSISVPENFDYSNDTFWNELEKNLRQELYGNNVIKESAKKLYESESFQMSSAKNCWVISEKIEIINKELDELTLKLKPHNDACKQTSDRVKRWTETLKMIQAQVNYYKPYDPNDYPITSTTSSKNALDEWEKFGKWLTSFPTEPHNTPENKLNNIEGWYNTAKIETTNIIGGLPLDPPQIHLLGELKIITVRKTFTKLPPISPSQPSYYNSVIHYYFHPGDRTLGASNGSGARFAFNILYYDTPSFNLKITGAPSYQLGSPREMLGKLSQMCGEYLAAQNLHLSNITTYIQKLQLEIDAKNNLLTTLQRDVLTHERKKFLQFWNDPYNDKVRNLHFEAILPDVDPLADLLVKLESDKEKAPKTYYFNPTENGYTNQYGQSLPDFVKSKYLSLENSLSLFPIMEPDGNFSQELIKVVKNPKRSEAKAGLPIIKFIETYKITIGWQGYGLGELSHSVNLFPGESKELVVEKKTRLTTKQEESKKQGTETKQNLSSSFEDNLSDTFSEENKSDNKTEAKTKTDHSNTSSSDYTQNTESSSTLNWNIEAKVGWGWGSVSGGASGNQNTKSSSSTNNKKAFSVAQNNEGLKASNQSKDVLRKNVSNSIKKVANETSVNNKVEFTASSSQEFQSELSNKEIIKLENPNIGRTVNYNFFQLQNLYGTTISLSDVKIVINSGSEVIEGTGINDIRVYELEEFGKIFANSSQTDHDVLVASIIARQVMKHYGNFLPGLTNGNGAVRLKDDYTPNRNSLEILNYTSEELGKELTRESMLEKLKAALSDLKAMPFYFSETEVQSETTVSVNAGAYHLEAQVGFVPATEKYLEDRRNIETEQKKAELAHMQEQTKKGVFHHSIPPTVTHLNYDYDK